MVGGCWVIDEEMVFPEQDQAIRCVYIFLFLLMNVPVAYSTYIQ